MANMRSWPHQFRQFRMALSHNVPIPLPECIPIKEVIGDGDLNLGALCLIGCLDVYCVMSVSVGKRRQIQVLIVFSPLKA